MAKKRIKSKPIRFENVIEVGGCIDGKELTPFVAKTPEEQATLTGLMNLLCAGMVTEDDD